jgi:hypothetical protein
LSEFKDVLISKYLYIIIFAFQTDRMNAEKASNCTIGRKKSEHQLDIETERYYEYREKNAITVSKRDLPVIFEEVPYVPDYKRLFEDHMDVDEFNVNSFTKGSFTMSNFQFSRNTKGETVTQFKQHMADEDEVVQVVQNFASENIDDREEITKIKNSRYNGLEGMKNAVSRNIQCINQSNNNDDEFVNPTGFMYEKGPLLAMKTENRVFPLPNEPPLRFLNKKIKKKEIKKIPIMPWSSGRAALFFQKAHSYVSKNASTIFPTKETGKDRHEKINSLFQSWNETASFIPLVPKRKKRKQSNGSDDVNVDVNVDVNGDANDDVNDDVNGDVSDDDSSSDGSDNDSKSNKAKKRKEIKKKKEKDSGGYPQDYSINFIKESIKSGKYPDYQQLLYNIRKLSKNVKRLTDGETPVVNEVDESNELVVMKSLNTMTYKGNEENARLNRLENILQQSS